ncbi:Ger(x)C family spore germination C-terminal domain-containing protein [Peribacillus sp. SCS-37]|uniref:Ger(x)C family spore germination protein n=1 Tax=Paraperibacillus esterisolvens TaxID=3115296 RepID=UPI003906562A
MRAFTSFILLLSSMCLLTGCSPFTDDNTVEEIAPVTFLSVEAGEEKGKLKVSTLVPPVMKEDKQFFSTNVTLLEQGRRSFNLKYYREIKLGQLRMLFINEKVAKNGIISLIDTILIDPDVSPRLYLVVLKGDFEAFIKNRMQRQKDLDYYLYRMFKHYEQGHQGEISVTNIHEFMEKVYSPYSDPYIPVFKVNKENFNYEGTGFFENGKLKGGTDKNQDQFFQLLNKNHFLKNMVITPLDVSLGEVRSHVTTHVNLNDHTVSFKINYRGRIDEYRGTKDLDRQASVYELVGELERYMEEGNVSLLKKMQELKVDPLEVGGKTMSPASKPMPEEDWKKFWESAKIKVDCHFELEPLSI